MEAQKQAGLTGRGSTLGAKLLASSRAAFSVCCMLLVGQLDSQEGTVCRLRCMCMGQWEGSRCSQHSEQELATCKRRVCKQLSRPPATHTCSLVPAARDQPGGQVKVPP